MAGGIFKGLFGRTGSKPQQDHYEVKVDGHITGPCRYEWEVVGESHYQEALSKIAGPKEKTAKEIFCKALIVPEPTNQYDKNACAIYINGLKIGYMERLDAKSYLSFLKSEGRKRTDVFSVDAEINGGWLDAKSEGNYGVMLDLEPD